MTLKREKYRMRGLNSRPLACEASVITTTPTRPVLASHSSLITLHTTISHPTQMTTANTWYPCSCPDCRHRFFYCPSTRQAKWRLESGDAVKYPSSSLSSHVRSAIFYISNECHRQFSFISHFANVNHPFRSSKDNELSIRSGDVVIIRTADTRGWCYAETLNGDHGYIPIRYTTPVIPTEPYVPEWKTLSTGVVPSPPVRIIRKDVVLRQRDSLRKSRSMHSSFRSRYGRFLCITVVASPFASQRPSPRRIATCRPVKVVISRPCNRRNSAAEGPLCAVQADPLREARVHPP